jgi:peptidyl-prolyl cis-trans isomerase B (cyclophilin B)
VSLTRAAASAVVVLAPLLVAGCGGGGSSAGGSQTTTEAFPASTAARPVQASGCRTVPTPKPRAKRLPAPRLRLDPARRYELVVKTNCGSFTITLDVRRSPHTSASLVYLARKHFFDGVGFHRIVPGFVIQGGDPTGSGSGGPGYSTHDRVPPTLKYDTGVVAMAKTGAEPAGTGGSQFFVMTAAAPTLPPDYALAGRVTKGLDVVERIGALGDASEQPTQPVVMQSVRVVVR